MSGKKACRYLTGKTCSIIQESCPFWANVDFQEHCQQRVVKTMQRHRNGGSKPCHGTGRCSLIYPKACLFAEEPALRAECQRVMDTAWRLCTGNHTSKPKGGPNRTSKNAAERMSPGSKTPV